MTLTPSTAVSPSPSYIYHPRLGAYTTVEVLPISSDPDQQVADTIEVMERYAREDAASPQIQAAASEALGESGGDGGGAVDPVAAVWHYVRSRLIFSPDATRAGPVQSMTQEEVVEVLVRPRDLLTWGEGDCDDYVTLGKSMLLALGVPSRFATVAADPNAPGEYSHVYLVAYPSPNVRVPMDLSHVKALGWEVDNRFGKMREWGQSPFAAGGLG